MIKYSEPSEARQPSTRWRLYQFKGEEVLCESVSLKHFYTTKYNYMHCNSAFDLIDFTVGLIIFNFYILR